MAVALILGGAPSVFDEAHEAAVLLNRRHVVVAANLAGIEWLGPLAAWATLHPEHLPTWRRQRKGPAAARHFTPGGPKAPEWAETAPERWPGSSGLYAVQVALFELGATGAILCGIPMDADAGHFTGRAQWESVTGYRRAFAQALPVIGARTRSLSGWTRELFGPPTQAWIEAIDNTKPLGATRPPAETTPMHTVKNVSKAEQSFWADDGTGERRLYRLQPGDAVLANIDPRQPRFRRGGPYQITSLEERASDLSGLKPASEPTSGEKPKTKG